MSSLTAAEVAPLEANAVWTAEDVADPEGWTTRLDESERRELREALAFARSRAKDVLDVTREDFPLTGLAPVIAEIARELIDGRGFHRIAGIPVRELGPEDSSWVYWGIGMHLGTPWAQNARGHVLGDVKDQGKGVNDPTARGNEIGGAALPFHSDGSDLVGLLCLGDGVSGGESLVANAVAAHNELVQTEPELAGLLYDGLPYDFRGEQRPGGAPYYKVPVFTRHRTRLFVRYIRPFIESSQRHPEAPRLGDEQRRAMAAYDRHVYDPRFRVEMKLEPGDIQFVNNYHVLHGRNAYQDDAAGGKVRWLKRLWLATDALASEDRPERFRAAGSMSHWDEKRTKA